MNTGAIERVFRDEAGRVLATLIRLVGDFELAEEGLQEAFAAALRQWPQDGVPSNARAWLVNVGRHKAIDRLRRRVAYREKQRALAIEAAIAGEAAPIDRDDVLDDDMLRLIFTCCHPALNLETQVALTLRAVCGLSTTAVARAFLVAEDTMAQRLVRAKTKIRVARIPYQTPDADQLGERIEGVLAVVYQVFTEGYAPTTGGDLTRADLCGEAIRLGRLLRQLMPQRAAIAGLLALMLLHDARRDARASAEGDLIQLEFQDRGRWNRDQIGEGAALVNAALRAPGIPSAYAVQAAIAALHAQAGSFAATDWRQIVGLYEVLLRLNPSPVVALNHAAAVSMVDGPQKALNLVDALAARESLAGYHLLPAVRADLLRRLGRRDDACAAYRAALTLVRLDPERRWLTRRLAELEADG
ncbi:RNA polymerase subunit sigma-24 [Bradyrhizobium sp. U87765 SZCCT0131]|uniref:RNA polymerase sigma factor n=1 Tax=unclassified Bradyrhizobium TaxID=2631580 RepID=UPI001BA7F6F4|nr:RNA polymerase subunit sigma-24 [Bradyrhizobium sp. U87765 SZCCT0131]MBR1260293.1 RNA polymerase subunit sigma-24 [Bradyrhizobium sp. U87765 SZCCT0134]MBR1307458.1 RNA polymerase subunit sigma-24 [Bradyrhizobium sp. U87765 SZCCT0110]MBR1321412.1 RNA polymerase subunit sigma-24 [Bradyrhizobium sp. U87765 SZCCT0109]MBR1349725.1 RNA polymerase subunit sigma-24 [Bradyrhizobium sp. U87765 SZCCT0048]